MEALGAGAQSRCTIEHSVPSGLPPWSYLGFFPPDVLTLMHRSCSLTVVLRLGDAFVMWGLLCLSGGAEEAGELGREEPTPRASGAV